MTAYARSANPFSTRGPPASVARFLSRDTGPFGILQRGSFDYPAIVRAAPAGVDDIGVIPSIAFVDTSRRIKRRAAQ